MWPPTLTCQSKAAGRETFAPSSISAAVWGKMDNFNVPSRSYGRAATFAEAPAHYRCLAPVFGEQGGAFGCDRSLEACYEAQAPGTAGGFDGQQAAPAGPSCRCATCCAPTYHALPVQTKRLLRSAVAFPSNPFPYVAGAVLQTAQVGAEVEEGWPTSVTVTTSGDRCWVCQYEVRPAVSGSGSGILHILPGDQLALGAPGRSSRLGQVWLAGLPRDEILHIPQRSSLRLAARHLTQGDSVVEHRLPCLSPQAELTGGVLAEGGVAEGLEEPEGIVHAHGRLYVAW